MAKEKAKIKQYTRPTDHLFMTIVYAFCAIALIAILIPLIFVVAASFSSPDALALGQGIPVAGGLYPARLQNGL